jgi:3'(2'), 5'-bisphosphate nucleotidase
MHHQLAHHTAIALHAAERAGTAIMQVYARDFEVEFKSDQSPLTEADRAAHTCIVAALAETNLPVLSEESDLIAHEIRRHWPRYWLVDPLDGTKEFVRRNGDFTVNIALIENGEPVLGVVSVPAHSDLYWGIPGIGAFQSLEEKNGDFPIVGTFSDFFSNRWEKNPPFFQSLELFSALFPIVGKRWRALDCRGDRSGPVRVVASRSHGTPDTEAFIARLEDLGRGVEQVARGSALKMCLVAAGEADVYPRLAPTMEWDTAAAQAIVAAAGGRVVVYDDAARTAFLAAGPAGLMRAGQTLAYNRAELRNPWFVALRPDWLG